jgi:hypothetical protein
LKKLLKRKLQQPALISSTVGLRMRAGRLGAFLLTLLANVGFLRGGLLGIVHLVPQTRLAIAFGSGQVYAGGRTGLDNGNSGLKHTLGVFGGR